MSATSTKQSSKTDQSTSRRQGPREGSVVWAMIQVLDGKRKPMKPAEILAEIQKRGLAKKLSGKTPEASVAARLAVHVGVYFERPEKGKYQLKKGVTAKSVSGEFGSQSSTTSAGASKSAGSKRAGKSQLKAAAAAASTKTTPNTDAPPEEPAAA
jgi:hypothetical protein